MNTVNKPETLECLQQRCYAIAGKTIGELASQFKLTPPSSLHRAKGWIGQLLEQALGATAKSKPTPDFEQLGIELKTLPIDSNWQPTESTYVCVLNPEDTSKGWHNSLVKKKLSHVLWIPIQAAATQAISNRRIGLPIFWQPTTIEEKILQQDWEELMEMYCLGHTLELSAKFGTYLQVRPKAANNKSQINVLDDMGNAIYTVPKGFYLRTLLTKKILASFNS